VPSSSATPTIRHPPEYCQLAQAACDQEFGHFQAARGIFLYPTSPETIASTIEGAASVLSHADKRVTWRTWKDFKVPGQIIFCEICRRMRFADTIFADVTTLNFNVLFEIGFALGLDLPVVPIRDASYVKNKLEFEALGMIDTIGYLDFKNAAELAQKISTGMPFPRISQPHVAVDTRQPVYLIKGHLETEGEVKLISLLKKSKLRFRVFDVQETPRLSVYEARRQVAMSLGVVAHLLDPNRAGALVHNARCALVTGMAAAAQKKVLVLQEGDFNQPIDYRDLVIPYKHAARLEGHLEPFIHDVVDLLQDSSPFAAQATYHRLEQLNLGDVAAENEIVALRSYFVRTAQFNAARRGEARLVTGRKGAGKTAIFYGIRHSIPHSNAFVVLDLKPEGYQFTKLREAVLDQLTEGMQAHTMMAFWDYILLCELAQKIIDQDYSWAMRDENRRRQFEAIRDLYARQPTASTGDFSERLLGQVDSLIERFEAVGKEADWPDLTQALFREEIPALTSALAPYLAEKEAVWILVDNLDKGWPIKGAAVGDVLIIRALLESTRKLQRQFDQKDLQLSVLVFLRNDIYDLLIRQTSDRGKDTQIALDWNDEELLREIVRQRMSQSLQIDGVFDDIWRAVFAAHVGVRDSFSYILERTLMRPRDLLNFLRQAVEVAVNRRHEQVTEDDIKTAERSYSEDALLAMSFELRDISAGYGSLLYAFVGQPTTLLPEDVHALLAKDVPADRLDPLIDMLVWFGFLGVVEQGRDEPQFAYQVRYNVDKLLAPIRRRAASFVVHPAFHRALSN
jgi:hypothetical protein